LFLGILYPFHGYECSISIFSKCLLNLNQKIVCSNSKESFALIVTGNLIVKNIFRKIFFIPASLPYCIQNFNSPTSLCSKLAQSIATVFFFIEKIFFKNYFLALSNRT